MILPVAILAGGRATRLGPLAQTTPKALMWVAGRPFVEHQILRLKRAGVQRVVLCVGHLGAQIQAALGDGTRFGLALQYVADGEKLLGTAGALRQALPVLGPRFLVLYGDSYLTCDYAAVEAAFLESGRMGLMTVLRNDDQWDRSNVLFETGRILRYDKRHPLSEMRHIDYGLGALCAEAFSSYPAADGEPFDLADLYVALIEKGEMAGLEVTERFYEIGSPLGLEETRRFLERPCPPSNL